MLKIYCTECGNPTTYTSIKPKFCSSCGTPFDKLVVNKVLLQKSINNKFEKKTLPKIERKAETEDHEEDYDNDDINYVPEIHSLDVEMQEIPNKKTKIRDIIGSSKTSQKREKIQNKKLTKSQIAEQRQKFLQDFQKEAGAIRPKNKGQKDG